MDKKDLQITLLYHENAGFISGGLPHPAEVNEICKNISYRLAVPFPYTRNKKIIYGCLSSLGTIFTGLIGSFNIYSIWGNFSFDLSIIIGLFGGISFLLVAIVIIWVYIRTLRMPANIVTEIYKTLVDQHNIIYGKVDSIERNRNSVTISYQIDSSNTIYTYVSRHPRAYMISQTARLSILYLSDKIHVPL